MAIKMRRGMQVEFNPSKMQAGEWAVSIDPEAEKQKIWMCFAPGVIKEIMTTTSGEVIVLEAKQYRDEAEGFKNATAQLKTDVISLKDETKGYRDEAKTSETNAKNSEDNASDSATLAQSWAEGGTGTRTGEDANNAKYWSDQAKAAAKGDYIPNADRGVTIAELVNGTVPESQLKKASTTNSGIVKPDGTTITIDADGTIHSLGEVDIDDEMSDTSENPVQNKVIKEYVDGFATKEQFESVSEEIESIQSEINDVQSEIDTIQSTLENTKVVSEEGAFGLRYNTTEKSLQAYIDGAWVNAGGGGSSPFGATIIVKGLADSDIGKTVTLTHNSEVVNSKIVQESKVVEFTDIMNIGEYVIKCESYADKTKTITIEDVFAKNTFIVSYETIKGGSIYKFEGCEWMVTNIVPIHNYITLIMTKGNISKGIMGGAWPGYVANNNETSVTNFGVSANIMSNDKVKSTFTGLAAVYDSINNADLINGTFNRGFYLYGSNISGLAKDALQIAATNYSSFSGATNTGAWLGTVYSGYSGYGAYYVNNIGSVSGSSSQQIKWAVAPCVDIDASKVYLDGDEIKIA